MDINFADTMTMKSEEGLRELVDNFQKYHPDAVEAAIAELEYRGKGLGEEELLALRSAMQTRQENAEKEYTQSKPLGVKKWDQNIVKDEDAPEFYSQSAISGFAIFFGALSSAVLLAINLKDNAEGKNFFEILSFGIGYYSLEIWIVSSLSNNTGIVLPLNFLGAYILNNFFWKKYIGADTKYRAKPIWKPLIICLIISSALLYWALRERTAV